MDTSQNLINEKQARYKNNLDFRVKLPKGKFIIVSQVFLKAYHHPKSEINHTLAQRATGSYIFTYVDAKTCVILRDNNFTERLLFDRVRLAPHENFSTGK